MLWNWNENGVIVSKGEGQPGREFMIKRAGAEQVATYQARVLESLNVCEVLASAWARLSSGDADYEDAFTRTLHLRREKAVAEMFSLKVCSAISEFFHPAGLAQMFGADPERLYVFADEAVVRIRTANEQAEQKTVPPVIARDPAPEMSPAPASSPGEETDADELVALATGASAQLKRRPIKKHDSTLSKIVRDKADSEMRKDA